MLKMMLISLATVLSPLTELDRFDAAVQSGSSAGVKVMVVLKGDREKFLHVNKWETHSDQIKFGFDLESNQIVKIVLIDQHDYSIATIKTTKNLVILKRSDIKDTEPTRFFIEYCQHGSQCPDSFHPLEVH